MIRKPDGECSIHTGKTASERNFIDSMHLDIWSDQKVKINGPLSYHVKLQDGHMVRQHSDHILACTEQKKF